MEKGIYKGFHGVKDTAPGVVRGECVIDATLPDYLPEIRRIYGASATAQPTGKYLSGGKAEFAGTVRHVVYCGNADGGVSVLPLSGDYLLSFPAPDGCDPALLPVVCDTPICRLVGPRRISIRTPVSAAARCYEPRESSPSLPTLTADPDVIPLIHPVETHRAVTLSLRDVRLGDVIRSDGEVKVLSCEAVACVREATPTAAGVEARGDVGITLKLDRGDGIPSEVRRKIPFSEVIPWEGEPLPGGSASAWACVTSCEVSPSDGETASEISVDLTLDLSAEVAYPVEEEALVDLFSLKEPTTVQTERIGVTDVCFCGGGVYTLEGAAERSECNCEDAMTVLGESAAVSVESATVGEDGATVAGECRVFAAVGSPSGEGETVYTAANFRFPYSVTVPVPAECRAAQKVDASAIPFSVTVRLDALRLLASVETAFTVRLSGEDEVTVASQVDGGEGAYPERAPGEIVAVYPEGGETLWDVAHRYGVSPDLVAETNGLPDTAKAEPDAANSLDGVVRLLIG